MTYLAQAGSIADPITILKSQSAVVESAQAFMAEYDLPDIVFGGLMMILILFVHGFTMAMVNRYYVWESARLLSKKLYWLVEAIFYLSIVCIMMAHVLEIGIWSYAIFKAGLANNMREAVIFCGNTYTTVGYGQDILPVGWKLLTTIIALSVMFCFAWTTSVMLGMMKIYQEARLERRGLVTDD